MPNKNVFRLDVAMDNAMSVSRGKRLRDLPAKLDNPDPTAADFRKAPAMRFPRSAPSR